MIKAPRVLREFGYHRFAAWIPWNANDWEAFAGAIRAQPTLERFELIEQFHDPDDAPGTLGDAIGGLQFLTHLHVPWRALVRPLPETLRDERKASWLVAVLPPSLCNLVLRNDASGNIKSRVAMVESVLGFCSNLNRLCVDLVAGDEAVDLADVARVMAAYRASDVWIGANGLSSWDWNFSPP